MTELLSQILNGLAIGNVYAMLAIGFVLVFGVANLINFAQGSLFVVGGYLAYTFATLLGLPLALAATLAVALTAMLGLVIDRAFLRPLERGPRIAPLLATLAIAVILDETVHLIWSPDTKPFPSPLASTTWQVGNAYISAVDVLILAVGIGTIVALTLFLNRTWIGRAMRATAMDPEAAQQMGVDVSLMRSLTFGIAGLVGGVGGVLVGFYYQAIWPTMGIPLGIKGFTAALLGGISSIPGAIVGGLLLGVFESLTSGYLGSIYRNLIAYTLLLLVLFFRPQGLFGSRGLEALGGAQAAGGAVPSTSLMSSPFQTAESRPLTTPAWLAALLALAAASFPFWAPDTTWVHILGLAFIYAILAVSLTIVSGTAGQISVGHAGIWGVGAYVAAIVTTRYLPGLPIELTLIAAGLAGMVAGVLSGFFAARLSGHVIVMATLASGLIFYSIMLVWIPVTRGPMGVFAIPPPVLGLLGGLELWRTEQQYWLALAVLAVVLLLADRLLGSDVGRLWRAVREDRLAAVASGVPAVRYLLMAFGVSGFLAGVSGALYAHYVTAISPNSFLILVSFQILAIVVLGGLGNLTGAVFGAIVLIGATEALRGFGDYRMVTYGVILLAVILFRPRGLFGSR
jgi:branched-chain amino acid transport system permease protein